MKWLIELGCLALLVACGASNATVDGAGPSGSSSGSGSGSGSGAGQGSLPCDVDAILEKNCRSCHGATPQFSAPSSLVTLADLTGPAKTDPSKKEYEVVAARVANDASPMPPAPNARLSDADRAVLTAWAGAGAPASTEACSGTSSPNNPAPTVNCTPDLELSPASAWEMPAASGDQYVCYGIDVTRPTPTHVVGFAPRVDNTKIVHHIVLFESPTSYSSTPTPCNSGTSLQWRMVMGWAPGGKGLDTPAEAGFPLATTGATHYVMQVHYSNPQSLSGEKDTSGFSLCTAAPRQYEADVMAFGTQSITIPPNANLTRTCTLKVPSQLSGVHFFAAMPHMHKLGTAMTTTLTPVGGGAKVDLGAEKNWSFGSQPWLTVNATSTTNDVITTSCSWTNNTGATVKYGEKTADEMCYSFTAYYPKVQSPIWSWAAPAITSTCQ